MTESNIVQLQFELGKTYGFAVIRMSGDTGNEFRERLNRVTINVDSIVIEIDGDPSRGITILAGMIDSKLIGDTLTVKHRLAHQSEDSESTIIFEGLHLVF
jgi:hypothetical protein